MIRFDKRGTGLSDRVTDAATFEERMDDIRAVMDATESREAVVMGYSDGGNMAALFAAMYPDRTRGLILFATQARWTRTDDFPYPVLTVAEYRTVIERLEREGPTEEWLFGFGAGIPRSDPEKDAAVYRYARSAFSPAAIAAHERMNLEVDMRATTCARPGAHARRQCDRRPGQPSGRSALDRGHDSRRPARDLRGDVARAG